MLSAVSFSSKLLNPVVRLLSINTNLNRRRRVLFNVPGSDQRKLDKAFKELTPDSLVLDLEDGVAPNRKEAARELIVSTLKSQLCQSERVIRMNSIDSGLEEDDLKYCVEPSIANFDSILIPKVDCAKHVRFVDNALERMEKEAGLPVGTIKILAAIESAIGIVRLPEICQSSARLEALIYASEDLCADMGMTRTPSARELIYTRGAVVTHACAFGLQAIDMVCIDYKNQEQLIKESIEGAQMGYTGKQAIHPAQIGPINEAFKHNPKTVEFAQKIIAGFEEHKAKGTGAFSLDGKMIDLPMVKWAQRIVSQS